MFNIVLHHPEIPHNTGAAGRLAVATQSRLHLIRPLGFSLEEKHLRRAGLDYWQHVELHVWDSLEELCTAAEKDAHFWYLSTKASNDIWSEKLDIKAGDYFIFGAESKGLPESWLEKNADTALRIPMPGEHARSLNLSTAISIMLYEGMRRCSIPTTAP